MPAFLTSIAAAVGLLLAAHSLPAVAIAPGQVDDFEDAGLQGWQAGAAANPTAPANSSSGGPLGADDSFLRLTSNGSAGAGGKLVAFNTGQWSGDYLEAGVTSIRMQVANYGQTDLVLRLILEDAIHSQSLATLLPMSVPVGSGWTTISFSLASANLAGGNYATVLGSVTALNLVHSPGFALARSGAPNIAAQLGVDNVTAVPEPVTLVLLSIGLGALVLRGAARQGPLARNAGVRATAFCTRETAA